MALTDQNKLRENVDKAFPTSKTKVQGTEHAPVDGDYYDDPEITADIINDLRRNIFWKGAIKKLMNLIFQEPYMLEVYDSNGDIDEDVTTWMKGMFDAEDVNLWANMRIAYKSTCGEWGITMYNDVWENEGNVYTLEALRHLPSKSFKEEPLTGDVYTNILKGIVLENDKRAFYQDVDGEGTIKKIENVFYVIDPVSEDIAGEPMIIPMVPILNMLKFLLNMEMKKANRIGIPPLFVRVTDPKTYTDGTTNDVDYTNELIAQWSTSKAFSLRGNQELVDPKLDDSFNNLDIINMLIDVIIGYISPTDMISSGGTRLGGGDAARETLLMKYIKGEQAVIEEQFARLGKWALAWNGYEGYTVKIIIPSPEIDKTETNLKQAAEGREKGSITINEHRKKIGLKELDEAELAALTEENAANAPPEPQPFGQKEEIEDTRKTDPTKEENKVTKSMQKTTDEELTDRLVELLEAE